jgi:hypothetical protein
MGQCYDSAIVPLKSDGDGVVVIEQATRFQFFDPDVFVFDNSHGVSTQKIIPRLSSFSG